MLVKKCKETAGLKCCNKSMTLTNDVLFLQHCVLVSQIMTILSKRLQGLILDSDSLKIQEHI